MYYIFDTNFYRDIAANRNLKEVENLITTLRQKELGKGIKPMMCSIVAQELISHLDDTGGGTNCTKASVALYLHTGDSKQYALIPLPEVQIAKMIYAVDWKERINTQRAFGTILYELATAKKKCKIIKKYKNEIVQTRNHVLGSESTFADEVEKLFQRYDPSFKLGQLPFGSNSALRKRFLQFIQSQKFEDETLHALLTSVYNLLHAHSYPLPPIAQVSSFGPLLHDFYLRSMVFRRMYFTKLSSNAYDLRVKNHSNYIWDEYVLTAVGNTINGEEIGLVTSDKGIRDTLLKFNPNLKIMTTDEYASFIGIKYLKKEKNFFQKCVAKIKKMCRKIQQKLNG